MAAKATRTANSTKGIATSADETKALEAKTVKKAEEEKAPEKKAAARKVPAKKAPARKAAAKTVQEVYVQFWGKEVKVEDIAEKAKDIWTKDMGNKETDLKSLRVYIKPEENAAHYVINDDVMGSIEL